VFGRSRSEGAGSAGQRRVRTDATRFAGTRRQGTTSSAERRPHGARARVFERLLQGLSTPMGRRGSRSTHDPSLRPANSRNDAPRPCGTVSSLQTHLSIPRGLEPKDVTIHRLPGRFDTAVQIPSVRSERCTCSPTRGRWCVSAGERSFPRRATTCTARASESPGPPGPQRSAQWPGRPALRRSPPRSKAADPRTRPARGPGPDPTEPGR
jgi:hypothetical protein